MSTEAEKQPTQITDIPHEELSDNAMRSQFHGPESAEKHNVQKGFSRKQKLIAGGAFIGVLAGGVVLETAISNGMNTHPQATHSMDNQPTDEATVTSHETGTPSPASTDVLNTMPPTSSPENSIDPAKYINVKETPKSVIESGLFDTLAAEQQAEVKKYEAMPLATFRKLPQSEQLKYAQYIYDNNAIRTKYNLSHSSDIGKQLVDRLTSASPDNTPQQVIDQNNFNDSLGLDLIYDGGSSTPFVLDKDSAKKLQVLTTAHNSGAEESGDSYIDAVRIAGKLEVGDATAHQSKVIGSGDQVRMIINADFGKQYGAAQDTYSLLHFKDITGKDRATWQMQTSYAMDSPQVVDLK